MNVTPARVLCANARLARANLLKAEDLKRQNSFVGCHRADARMTHLTLKRFRISARLRHPRCPRTPQNAPRGFFLFYPEHLRCGLEVPFENVLVVHCLSFTEISERPDRPACQSARL